jgi:cytochrome b6-f complex iron-sulfur subunit
MLSMESDENAREGVPRRRFLDLLLKGEFLALLGLIGYPVVRFLFPPAASGPEPKEVRVCAQNELTPGSGRVVRLGSHPVLVLKEPDGVVSAVSATCTHLHCTVQYRPDQKLIWCACHDGKFDLKGKNVGGPPPAPLEPYTVQVKNGDIYVRRSAKRAG